MKRFKRLVSGLLFIGIMGMVAISLTGCSDALWEKSKTFFNGLKDRILPIVTEVATATLQFFSGDYGGAFKSYKEAWKHTKEIGKEGYDLLKEAYKESKDQIKELKVEAQAAIKNATATPNIASQAASVASGTATASASSAVGAPATPDSTVAPVTSGGDAAQPADSAGYGE
jgi:hypothetical protein